MKIAAKFIRTAIRCGILPAVWEIVAQFCEFDIVYIGWLQNLIAKHFKK